MSSSQPISIGGLGVQADRLKDISCSPLIGSATLDSFKSHDSSGVPLNSDWTFYLDRVIRGTTAAEYKASLKHIYKVSTVQGFWAVLNHIPVVADLPDRCSYHLMRGGRQPLWEDPENTNGGTWRFKCPKGSSETAWREMLVAAIGEQLSEAVAPGDEVCGITVSCRRDQDLLQIWNTNSKLSAQATMYDAVHKLLPEVRFSAEFYKSNQAHEAFEGHRRGRH